jgi:hypothetical protein
MTPPLVVRACRLLEQAAGPLSSYILSGSRLTGSGMLMFRKEKQNKFVSKDASLKSTDSGDAGNRSVKIMQECLLIMMIRIGSVHGLSGL